MLLIALLIAQAATPAKARAPKTPVKPPAVQAPPPLCSGDYADALPAEKANAILGGENNQPFVFAIRNTATYEHVYYGHDGKLRRAYLRSVVHGTGFAYRVVNGETQIVTNEHVAGQPDVTDDEHPVEGVPLGSKKVREQLKIVRDENDDYEPGHVALSKLLADPQADIAVLKARKQLAVMPYRMGRSASLRPGNLVQVRGFPLGAFAALNSGKAIFVYGDPGTGKSYITQRLARLLDDEALVPHAIAVGETIIEVFNPLVHMPLDVPSLALSGGTREELDSKIESHVLGTARLMARYQRQPVHAR